MRTRFKKVWCEACKSMQFAGECGHARVEPEGFHTGLAIRLNGADVAGLHAEAARRAGVGVLLPKPTKWKLLESFSYRDPDTVNDNAFPLAAGPE